MDEPSPVRRVCSCCGTSGPRIVLYEVRRGSLINQPLCGPCLEDQGGRMLLHAPERPASVSQYNELQAAVAANTQAVAELKAIIARPRPFHLLSAVQEVGGTGVMVTIRRMADGADAMWVLHDDDFGGPPI